MALDPSLFNLDDDMMEFGNVFEDFVTDVDVIS